MNPEDARLQTTNERHPIDSIFLELLKEITAYIPNIEIKEAELTRKWLSKLTGTHPITRNEYARCLLYQLQATGKLDIPFTQIPDMWTELVPLHDALFGPKPGATAPKKAWRGEKVKATRKLTQQELLKIYGTDRIGMEKCIEGIKKSDEINIYGLITLVQSFSKDNGVRLHQVTQNVLDEFRKNVGEFYENQTELVSNKLAQDQVELKLAYHNDVMSLQKTRDSLAKEMAEKCPNFDWSMFRKYNKDKEEKQTRLNKLRKQNEKLEERNKDLTIFLGELHTFVNERELRRQEEMATLAEEAKHLAALIDIELDKSLGLLPNEALEQSSLLNE